MSQSLRGAQIPAGGSVSSKTAHGSPRSENDEVKGKLEIPQNIHQADGTDDDEFHEAAEIESSIQVLDANVITTAKTCTNPESPSSGSQEKGEGEGPDLEALRNQAQQAKLEAERQREATVRAFEARQKEEAGASATAKKKRAKKGQKTSNAAGGSHGSTFGSNVNIGQANDPGPEIDFGEYPPPEGDSEDMVVVIDQYFNLTSRQFYEFFLADKAVFSIADFHALRGDIEIVTTHWKDYVRAPGAPVDPRFETPGTKERKFKAKMKVDSSFTRLHRVSRLIPLEDGFQMVTRALTPDVIFGTQFSVTDIWFVRDVPNARQCHLQILLGGYYFNYGFAVTLAMPIISSRIKGEGKEMWENWTEVAKLRLSRLAHELTQEPEGSDNNGDSDNDDGDESGDDGDNGSHHDNCTDQSAGAPGGEEKTNGTAASSPSTSSTVAAGSNSPAVSSPNVSSLTSKKSGESAEPVDPLVSPSAIRTPQSVLKRSESSELKPSTQLTGAAKTSTSKDSSTADDATAKKATKREEKTNSGGSTTAKPEVTSTSSKDLAAVAAKQASQAAAEAIKADGSLSPKPAFHAPVASTHSLALQPPVTPTPAAPSAASPTAASPTSSSSPQPIRRDVPSTNLSPVGVAANIAPTMLSVCNVSPVDLEAAARAVAAAAAEVERHAQVQQQQVEEEMRLEQLKREAEEAEAVAARAREKLREAEERANKAHAISQSDDGASERQTGPVSKSKPNASQKAEEEGNDEDQEDEDEDDEDEDEDEDDSDDDDDDQDESEEEDTDEETVRAMTPKQLEQHKRRVLIRRRERRFRARRRNERLIRRALAQGIPPEQIKQMFGKTVNVRGLKPKGIGTAVPDAKDKMHLTPEEIKAREAQVSQALEQQNARMCQPTRQCAPEGTCTIA